MSTDATMRLAKPRRRLRRVFVFLLAGALLAALGVGLLLIFGREPPSTNGDLVGAGVQLPAPVRSLVPTVNFSQAQPWPAGKQPIAPDGFRVPLMPPASITLVGFMCCPMGTCWRLKRARCRAATARSLR
jgi:hypothetical protein